MNKLAEGRWVYWLSENKKLMFYERFQKFEVFNGRLADVRIRVMCHRIPFQMHSPNTTVVLFFLSGDSRSFLEINQGHTVFELDL